METKKDLRTSSDAHMSYWTASTNEKSEYETLRTNLETDVVIVGGGIAGISVAYCLQQTGKKVVLLEDGYIGSGETGHTTAHLVNALDDRYYDIIKMYGEEKARLAAESHTKAIDFIEETARREKIDCDFERLNGYLFLHPTDRPDSLDREFDAALKAGVHVEKCAAVPGMSHKGPCIRFYNQGQFHPLKYLLGLCSLIHQRGAHIYTKTHAIRMDEEGVVTDTGFTVKAKHIVVTTNAPVNSRFMIPLKQFPYRTYVIAAEIAKNSLPHALWWDTGDHIANEDTPPYHYVRIQKYTPKSDLLLCGGEDHLTGLAETGGIAERDRYAVLENWMRQYFHAGDVLYKWSGQVMEPVDSLAYIGRNPLDKNNIYIATGDSGNGMTHGTIAGMLITDLINGLDNKWAKLYDPARFKLFSSGIFFREFISGFSAYLKTKPRGSAYAELEKLESGEAKIFKLDGKKYGIYKDEHMQLHIVGADCTHLGCTVKWNSDEHSWDCPCHGSRFTREGFVINGPANVNLPYHMEYEVMPAN